MTQAGKGDRRRPFGRKAWEKGYDLAFRPVRRHYHEWQNMNTKADPLWVCKWCNKSETSQEKPSE